LVADKRAENAAASSGAARAARTPQSLRAARLLIARVHFSARLAAMNVQRLLIALGLLILMAGIAWPILVA
jgi:hypothetical protein